MRVELTEISKSFGSVQALKDATLSVSSGEVVALVGDNGAGKSTLMKILAGALRPDGGSSRSTARRPASRPLPMPDLGIEMLYQDLALFDELNVTANVYLGREVVWAPWFFGGFLNFGDMRRKTKEIVDRFSIRQIGIHAEVGQAVGRPASGDGARARTVGFGSQIAILDEPTSALSPSAADEILEVVKNLARQGIGVVMISHNLAHVMEACPSHRGPPSRRGRRGPRREDLHVGRGRRTHGRWPAERRLPRRPG
jgi:ABC-type sugar transport system ATPase subunit